MVYLITGESGEHLIYSNKTEALDKFYELYLDYANFIANNIPYFKYTPMNKETISQDLFYCGFASYEVVYPYAEDNNFISIEELAVL